MRIIHLPLALSSCLLVGGCASKPEEQAPASAVPSIPAPSGPSVLLITLDTTRADRLSPYGHTNIETPTYQAIADAGTLFSHAYSTCPLTIPSHSTIMTGTPPPVHGVRDNGDFILGDEAITLAEQFQAAGYSTFAFTSAFPTQARWGFDQGFDTYHDPLSRLPDELDWRDERQAGVVIDDALATLNDDEGPAFVWIHLFDAHWPYSPPEPFASQYKDSPYDGEIAYADSQVGRFLTWWDQNHPDSVVLITSDHGEGLGDGGEQTHGYLLHDGTIRVPLLLRGPDIPKGAVIDEAVSHVDIAPTLLATANLPIPETMQGRNLLTGGSETAYSEALTGQFNLGLAPLFSLTETAGRYTEGGWGGFYPMSDQGIATEPDKDADLGPYTKKWERIQAGFPVPEQDVATEASLDAEAWEQLAALGYVGGDPAAPAGNIDPRDVIDIIPLTWRARMAIGSGRPQMAEKMLAVLETRMPNAFGVRTLRARLDAAQGRHSEATAAFTDLFLQSPQSTLALTLASLHERAGNWEEAVDWYQEALHIQSASPDAMAGLVRAYRMMGMLEQSQLLAEQFLQIYPDHARIILVRAELLLLQGNFTDALVDAQTALQLNPNSPWAFSLNAQIQWELGEADAAIDLLTEALARDRFNLDLRLKLAECFLEVGRNAEAVRTVRPAAALLPEAPWVQDLASRAQTALATERAHR